jgi:hypothetical protein
MKNIVILALLLNFAFLSAQTQDTLKRKKSGTVTEQKTVKKVVKTKDQKKVIRKATTVKSDTVLSKPATN